MEFVDTRKLTVRERLPGWFGRTFHSENMTLARWEFKAGASIHEHSHPAEEVWQVVAGELEITIAGETQVAVAGIAAIVPGDATHRVRALTDGSALVVASPRREEAVVVGGGPETV